MTDAQPDDRTVEEVAEEIAEHNRDPVTRREAVELELEEQGRSEEGKFLSTEPDPEAGTAP